MIRVEFLGLRGSGKSHLLRQIRQTLPIQLKIKFWLSYFFSKLIVRVINSYISSSESVNALAHTLHNLLRKYIHHQQMNGARDSNLHNRINHFLTIAKTQTVLNSRRVFYGKPIHNQAEYLFSVLMMNSFDFLPLGHYYSFADEGNVSNFDVDVLIDHNYASLRLLPDKIIIIRGNLQTIAARSVFRSESKTKIVRKVPNFSEVLAMKSLELDFLREKESHLRRLNIPFLEIDIEEDINVEECLDRIRDFLGY